MSPRSPGGADGAPPDFGDRLVAILATGDLEALLETFLREGPRYPPEVIEAQRARPDWGDRLAFAHTLPREVHAVDRYAFDPARVAGVRAPALLLVGGESPPFFHRATGMLHAALPDNEVAELPGQHHTAMESAPDLFSEAVLRFLDRRGGAPSAGA